MMTSPILSFVIASSISGTSWMRPEEIFDCGFQMILYPTTVIFRAARAIERALTDLLAGQPMPASEAFQRSEFEDLLGMPQWKDFEHRFDND